MHRRILAVPLSVAVVAVCLTAAPAVAAGDCDIILPAADRLESEFNLVSPSGTPSYVAGQIRNARLRCTA